MNTPELLKISVFIYTDYREFLRDWYAETRQSKKMSFRIFSKLAGFTSPNFLKLVMDGKRNLSAEGAQKFAKGLGFNKSETHFFTTLIKLNQSESSEEKQILQKQMGTMQKLGHIKPVSKEQHLMYSSWLVPVVYEMARMRPNKGLIVYLMGKIRPRASTSEIEKALSVLHNLGYLKLNKEGVWIPSQPVVTTGLEATSQALMEFHLNHIKLAQTRLEEVKPENRDYSSLTIGLPASKIPALKKRIQELRQDIIRYFAHEVKSDETYVVNIQLFPVTNMVKD